MTWVERLSRLFGEWPHATVPAAGRPGLHLVPDPLADPCDGWDRSTSGESTAPVGPSLDVEPNSPAPSSEERQRAAAEADERIDDQIAALLAAASPGPPPLPYLVTDADVRRIIREERANPLGRRRVPELTDHEIVALRQLLDRK